MLNGVAPLLMFNFPIGGPALPSNVLAGLPQIDKAIPVFGIPIPIYLDEKLTGIVISNESKNVDFATTMQPIHGPGPTFAPLPPVVDQSALSSMVTVEMEANKNSLILSTLLALADIAFSRVANTRYSISYFNGPTVIIGGLLHGFAQEAHADTELLKLTLQIEKKNLNGGVLEAAVTVVSAVAGALPL